MELAYKIAFDRGPIFAMKFCPSGAFKEGKCLGLLAIPSFDGQIELIELPILNFTDQKSDVTIHITKPNLILENDSNLNSTVGNVITAMDWSQVLHLH